MPRTPSPSATSNPTGYILTERLPVVKDRKAPKAAKPSRPALRLVGASL
jgi:hypothetical protein